MSQHPPENTPNLRVFPNSGVECQSNAGREKQTDRSSNNLHVVLHADDFGLNAAVTDGILHGFRAGLLTSTSLLSNAPDAERAISLWKQLLQDIAHPTSSTIPSLDARRRLGDHMLPFDLGVHLNLTQGRPLSGDDYPRELLDREGRFPGIFSLFARLRKCDAAGLKKVKAELSRQIEFALDRGLQPTHLNGHQYIEMLPALSAIVPELLDRYGIRVVRVAEEPLLFKTTLLMGFSPPNWALANVKRFFARRFHALMDRLGIGHPQRFHGTAHAGHINLDLMRMYLQAESKTNFVEIGLHPALEASETSSDPGWADPLASARPLELRLLTGSELTESFEQGGIRLGRLSKLAAA
jgi:chitin disaccharide deacetylase